MIDRFFNHLVLIFNLQKYYLETFCHLLNNYCLTYNYLSQSNYSMKLYQSFKFKYH